MLNEYSLCVYCGVLLKRIKEGHWENIENPDGECDRYGHMTTDPMSYRSAKFGDDIRTEILHTLGNLGFADKELGDVDGFGHFQFFSDFCAIVETDSDGFVYASLYDAFVWAVNAWSHVEADYFDWCEDQEEQRSADIAEDFYPDPFEPDIWDYDL